MPNRYEIEQNEFYLPILVFWDLSKYGLMMAPEVVPYLEPRVTIYGNTVHSEKTKMGM